MTHLAARGLWYPETPKANPGVALRPGGRVPSPVETPPATGDHMSLTDRPVKNYICGGDPVRQDGPTLVAGDASAYTRTPSGLHGILDGFATIDNIGTYLVGILAGLVIFGIGTRHRRLADTVAVQGVIVPLIVINCLASDLVPFAFLRRGLRAVQYVFLLPMLILHSALASPLFWGCIACLLTGVVAAPTDFCHRCMETGHLAPACPYVTGVAENVAAVAAATYTTMKLAKLMPPWLARLFPATALQMLVTLATRSTKGTQEFEFSGTARGGHKPEWAS